MGTLGIQSTGGRPPSPSLVVLVVIFIGADFLGWKPCAVLTGVFTEAGRFYGRWSLGRGVVVEVLGRGVRDAL